MKLILVLFSFFSLLSKPSMGQSLLKIELIGYKEQKLLLFNNINNILNSSLYDKSDEISVIGKKKIEQNFSNDSSIVVFLQIGKLPVYVFIGFQDTVHLKINFQDLSEKTIQKNISFTGEHALGNLFFNEWNINRGTHISDFNSMLKREDFFKDYSMEILQGALKKQNATFDS